MRQVAALFVRADSVYKTMPGVDAWDIDRDARRWPGGCQVVAHPPCRGWGVARHFSVATQHERSHALWAVEQIRQWGGVLEHPRGSTLWDAAGLPPPGKRDSFGGWTLPIRQQCFGHRAEKPTLLYIVGVWVDAIPSIPLSLGMPERRLFNKRGLRSGMPGFMTECTKAEREHTPIALAEWLVETARRCRVMEPA